MIDTVFHWILVVGIGLSPLAVILWVCGAFDDRDDFSPWP